MFSNLVKFAAQNDISFFDCVRIMDIVIMSAEVDTSKEWDIAQFLECQKGINSILRMLPMNQWEEQYNLYKPSYKALQENPEQVTAFREFKLKNYGRNYKHIVTMAEEYKKTMTANA